MKKAARAVVVASDEVKDEVKADTSIFIFLKLKQISILKSKRQQGMKGDEQKAIRISPVRREGLVSRTSGTTSKKLMVQERVRKL